MVFWRKEKNVDKDSSEDEPLLTGKDIEVAVKEKAPK